MTITNNIPALLCACIIMLTSTLSHTAQAKVSKKCALPEKVKINIVPETKEIELDYSRSLANLQKTKTDTVDPYGMHSSSITQGFMEGQISMKREVKLDFKQINRGKEVCLWYKAIDINVHITPKIVIAKEIKRNRCMHKAVLEHEHKHIDVDRDVVNETARRLGKNLYAALAKKGFTVGPVPAKDAQKHADKMVKYVMDITQKDYETLGKHRSERQAAVDTLEEYERVKALCPNFYKHKKLLYKQAVKSKHRHQH